MSQAEQDLASYRAYLDRLKRRKKRARRKQTKEKSCHSQHSSEDIVQGALVEWQEEHSTLRISEEQKLSTFARKKGLHSSYDRIVSYDLKFVVTKKVVRVETLSDFHTGKSMRADTTQLGPAQSSYCWPALAKLILLTTVYGLPFERIAKMLGSSPFSDVQIGRWFTHAARWFLPVYLYLAEQLAEASYLSLDDTKTRVLEMRRKMEKGIFGSPNDKLADLPAAVAELLGRTFPKKKGDGDKKQLNVSLLCGRSCQDDPQSAIYFYRTHFGSAGNLLEKLLAMRRRNNRKLTIHGDLSSQNLPASLYRELYELSIAGCGVHARRPFARFAHHDDELCDYMLRGFALLAEVEDKIERHGHSPEITLYYRRKYARPLWQALYRRCLSVISAETLDDCQGHRLWPKTAKMHQGASYVVKHFAELTRYIDDHHLAWTNNKLERLLRGEVILRVASKFRQTETGRVALDILRTIVMTCQVAGVSFDDYLKYVANNQKEVAANPHNFTPYSYASLHQCQRANVNQA